MLRSHSTGLVFLHVVIGDLAGRFGFAPVVHDSLEVHDVFVVMEDTGVGVRQRVRDLVRLEVFVGRGGGREAPFDLAIGRDYVALLETDVLAATVQHVDRGVLRAACQHQFPNGLLCCAHGDGGQGWVRHVF